MFRRARQLANVARRYRAAARMARAARAVGSDVQFDDAFAFARQIGITQQPEEIRWLFELVRELRPQRVLEIGLDEGGTLFLWTRAAAPDACIVSVDTRPPGRLEHRSPFQLVRRAFAHSQQHIELVMGADSHAEETRARVERAFKRSPVDFLFVDGDHSRDGVWADFRMYSPLVRPGGIVAFHDVSQNPAPSTDGVAVFWREFRADHETDERVANREPGFGIGVYRIPD